MVVPVGAERYRVTAKYGSNRLKTRDQLEREVREKYVTKAKASKVTVESFRVTKFEVGTGLDFLNHYITVEVVLRGSPIAPAVILAVLGVITVALYVLAIWLVGKEIVQPIAAGVAEVAEKAPAALTLGAGALLILALVLLGVRVPKKEEKAVAPRP